jgi:2-dehydro-3-deoxyphosphogluconate aldolase/(4S)-4-hydroxy-2-oxoglutarate aldolase
MVVKIRDIAALGAVIPEVTLTNLEQAVPLARALCAGGMRVLEFGMRSSVAAACIDTVRKTLPDAVVGAGGLSRAVDFAAADRAGAQFGATPGLTPELAAASRGARFPILPGVMTATEIIAARHAGFNLMKWYPAQHSGGIAVLRAFHSMFPDVLFVPAGELNRTLAAEYLALPNVACVGAGWIAPETLLEAGDWRAIEELARDAAGLR